MGCAYEEPGYIKICGYYKKTASNYYRFTCPKCSVELRLGTDGGDMVMLGSLHARAAIVMGDKL